MNVTYSMDGCVCKPNQQFQKTEKKWFEVQITYLDITLLHTIQ